MRRLDRVLGEARMLRIRRAARAQGLSDRPVTPNDAVVETEIADRILGDLMEASLRAGAVDPAAPRGTPGPRVAADGSLLDGRLGKALDVFDPTVLLPFVAACREAVDAVVAALDPAALVAASMGPKVLATIYPVPKPGDEIGRVRESAIADVAALATERALHEVVASVCRDNDRRRPVSPYADPGGVDLLDGKVVRPRKMKAAAARRSADRMKARRVLRERDGETRVVLVDRDGRVLEDDAFRLAPAAAGREPQHREAGDPEPAPPA